MGLTFPAGLTAPLGWVGLTWPDADEELLFAAGQRWISYGEQLAGIAQRADAAAAGVWQATGGEAVDAFRGWWTRDEGPARRLAEDAAAALLMGAALVAFAAATLALKIAFIVQLVILVVEVAQAIATAFATFGATTAEVPGFIAATRVLCRRLIAQVVEHVQTVIKDILDRAANLLKTTRGTTRGHGPLSGPRPGHILGPMIVKRYEGKAMLEKFLYETDPHHPENPFGWMGGAVRRLSADEREAHRLFVDDNGLLRSVRDGRPFDSRTATSLHSSGGRAIFVMDEQGNLYASTYQELGRFHHSTLGNGRPVAAAGEISVIDGELQHVTATSGHYQPGAVQMKQLVTEMDRQGVSRVPVYGFDGVTPWF